MKKVDVLLVFGLGALVVQYIQHARLKFQRMCQRPALIDGFLTRTECEAVIRAAQAKGLKRSQVGTNTSHTVSKARTSYQVFLEHNVPAVRPVIEKAEKYLGVPKSRFESLQVARYRKGEKYGAHYDSDEETIQKELRTDTLLMYLNDVESGGHTSFPKAHMKVTPQTGRAVHWKNIDDAGGILPCAYHASLPVKTGEKWICTVWVNL
jgi:prolyl 4-hydroxylase